MNWARNQSAFLDQKNGAIREIRRLAEVDRTVIEKLHELDIIHKHRRLVALSVINRSSMLFRWGHWPEPERLFAGDMIDGARYASGRHHRLVWIDRQRQASYRPPSARRLPDSL